MVQDNRRNVAPFEPRPEMLLATIKAAASNTKKVKWSEHALDRMDERGITTLDALRVLRTGDLSGKPSPAKGIGEWKCKITAPIKGTREVGVVTIVMSAGSLFIKTVEWEDLK